MSNLEYWKIICDMCASVHCGTYEHDKNRMDKEIDALSLLYCICKKADQDNENIEECFKR